MADVVRCERGHYYDGTVFLKCPHCEYNDARKKTPTEYKNEVSRYAAEYLNKALHAGADRNTDDRSDGKKQYFNQDLPTVSGNSDRFTVEKSDMYRHPQKEDPAADNERRAENGQDGKTIGFSVNHQKNYFVTGWIVCVDGPDKGHSFNLYYGYNTIGYSRSNQICLIEDVSVAKKVHCSVVYEDRKNLFYLVPEENHPTWLNDSLLESAAELKSGDLIRLGKSEFEFVAFCRGDRKWDKQDMKRKFR